jgi:MFS family permease
MISLIAFRGLQGLGAGAIQPLVYTVAGDLYTVQERARIQGWLSSVWGIAAIVGPAIGGLFVEYASWRWIFFINLPLGAVALFMIVRHLHEDIQYQQHHIDYAGVALLTTSVGLLIFGLLEGGVQWPWISVQSGVIFLVSALALLLFIWQEQRASEPTLPLWVFGGRLLIGVNLSGAVVGLLAIGLSTFLPTYAQDVLGTSAIVAGFTLAMMSMTWPLASTFSGRLYLRIGFRNTALIGTVFVLLSTGVFVVLPEMAPLWIVVIGCLLMGAGLGLINTPLITGIQSVVGWNRRGVVTGAYMFTQQLGTAVGAAIFGSIANSVLANWLQRAPSNLAGHLPTSVNEVSSILGSYAQTLNAATISYLQQGLYLAIHQIFVGLAIIALAGIITVLLIPRRFESLHIKDDPEQATSHSSTREVGKPSDEE